jgi:hypothetical protein
MWSAWEIWSPEERGELMPPKSCATALEHVRRRDFHAWQGLPRDCALADAAEVFELSTGYAVGHLGRRHEQASFRVASLEGYLEPVRVWYRDDAVVLVTGEYPELPGELGTLLADYGEPEAKLDYHQGVVEVAHGEWIYPQRGITLFLNADHSRLAKVAVYAPASMQHYEAELAPRERTREFDEE